MFWKSKIQRNDESSIVMSLEKMNSVERAVWIGTFLRLVSHRPLGKEVAQREIPCISTPAGLAAREREPGLETSHPLKERE